MKQRQCILLVIVIIILLSLVKLSNKEQRKGAALEAFTEAGADITKQMTALKQLDNVADLADVMKKFDLGNILKRLPTDALDTVLDSMDPKVLGSMMDDIDPKVLGKLAGDMDPKVLKKLHDVNPSILKKLDNIPDLPAGLTKKLDDVTGAGSSAATKAKNALTSGSAKKLAGAAVLAGGALYIDKKLKDESKAERECVGYCLPENWDETTASGFGTLGDDQIKYTTLESIKESNDGKLPKSPGKIKWDEFPLCNSNIEKCGDYCIKQCGDLIDSGIPGGAIVDKALDAANNVVDDLFDKIGGPLADLGKAMKWIIIVVVILMVIGLLVKSQYGKK
ncbi:hypothetical protein N9C10_01555 [Flavobacteriaceae bacterium]|nr:hypothetical protein [Flavobacteriaceae bacterium]